MIWLIHELGKVLRSIAHVCRKNPYGAMATLLAGYYLPAAILLTSTYSSPFWRFSAIACCFLISSIGEALFIAMFMRETARTELRLHNSLGKVVIVGVYLFLLTLIWMLLYFFLVFLPLTFMAEPFGNSLFLKICLGPGVLSVGIIFTAIFLSVTGRLRAHLVYRMLGAPSGNKSISTHPSAKVSLIQGIPLVLLWICASPLILSVTQDHLASLGPYAGLTLKIAIHFIFPIVSLTTNAILPVALRKLDSQAEENESK